MRKVYYGADLDVRWSNSTRQWVLLREIRVSWLGLKEGDVTFYVPAGFRTDLASVPSIVPGWLVPKIGRYNLPAVVHDWCYEGNTRLTKAEADLLFLDGMKAVGVAAWRRPLMYAAVRAFGKGRFA